MECKIVFKRDPETLKITNEIKLVKAPNGKRSLLFDSIREVTGNDKTALTNYYKTYTDEFKNNVDVVNLDKNNEPLFDEVKDIIIPPLPSVTAEDNTPESSDPLLREKYFHDGENVSMSTMLQRIVDNNNVFKPLAEKLLTIPSKDVNIKLVSETTSDITFDTGVVLSSAGEYNPSTNIIEILETANFRGSTGQAEPTIVHEILHAYTHSELRKKTTAVKELEKIYNTALDNSDLFTADVEGEVYALRDLDEFIVAVFTDGQFIKDLQQLPSVGPNKSLWEDVLEWMKALFKFNKGERTLFDDAFYVSSKIISDAGLETEAQQAPLPDTDPYQDLESNQGSDIADVTIEDQYNLRNTDGSRKKYTEDQAMNVARGLNKSNKNRPFKFSVIKVMGEKGDSKVYYAVKVVERTPDDGINYSLGDAGDQFGQPDQTIGDGVKIDVDGFKKHLNNNGYTEDQIRILESYNQNTAELTGRTVEVKVSELPAKLRKVFELKGEEVAQVYETKDPATGETGWITYRVSNIQDLKKVKGQSKEKATAQEQNPKSILAREMGTKMHNLNEIILKHITESKNKAFQIDSLRNLTNPDLWKKDAFEAFSKTSIYAELQKQGGEIFLNESGTTMTGESYTKYDSTKMVDKLVNSMLGLYHQIYKTQNEINNLHNQNTGEEVSHKPIILLEKPFLDKSQDQAGTMDIFVVFSDGTASIYDHKFTDLKMERKEYKSPSKEELAEIFRIRKAQGLPTKEVKSNYWHYILPDNLNLYRKEESWNGQIGRYAQMVTQLYKVKDIRQARILPVATTYTRVKTGNKKKTKEGKVYDELVYDPKKSKVQFILTGEDDLGVPQIALEVEKTGDVGLDKFIQMLIDQKKALNKERSEKHAWNDPRYIDRINKLTESIQALLKSRDISKISESVEQLATQIKSDLENTENKITFEQIIHHLRDIEMFESFITLSKTEIDKLEKAHEDKIKEGEENPYTTFKNRLAAANYELEKQAKSMHDQMTAMVYSLNREEGYMSDALFSSFTKQVDMTELGKFMTHLRESNHPIISLFSQLLDKIDTNVINERRDLKSKLDKVTGKLQQWGQSNGLSGTEIYKPLINENNDLIWKFTNYKKDVFSDHMDPEKKKDNRKWFKENFERVGRFEELFQTKYKEIQEYYKRAFPKKEEYNAAVEKWLNQNDVTHNDGDNDAWFSSYVQHWLTPKNPEEYYTEEYKNLLKSENKPLLDFYNLYTDQIGKLQTKADFRIKPNFIAEIRKDMIDTMVQDGIFTGLKQQGKNVWNYFTKTDKDDGFQNLEGLTEAGKKVPVFFTDRVGKDNKSLDLGKSLMIFSDFVNRYNGIKSAEHGILSMRELVAKTQGVASNATGKVLRNARGEMQLKQENNKKLLDAFDTWIDYYVYGEKKKGNPMANKIVDAISQVTSRRSVALNWMSALGGHINAEAQNNMIAKKSTYFSRESLSAARKDSYKTALTLESVRKGTQSIEDLDSKLIFSSMFFELAQEDLSHEKANEVSISSMRKLMKQDYAFVLQRLSDDAIDNNVLGAMMRDYGIDPLTGKTYPLKRLKEMYKNSKKEVPNGRMKGTMLKDINWKSLWDMVTMESKKVDLGNGYFEDLEITDKPLIINQFTGEPINDKTYSDFRRKTKSLITTVKGNMSAGDISGYQTHIVGKLVMKFRGWMPATIRTRAKGEEYNLTMEQFEVGRWMAAKEMVVKNLSKTGAKFLQEMIPFVEADFHGQDINDPDHPMRIKYNQYIADNPHLAPDPNNPSMEQVTFDEYYNTYVAEVKALAKEVQTYLALAGMLSLFLLAGGGDELKENPIFRLPVALIERAMLEIGFFLPLPGLGWEETTQMFKRAPFAAWSSVDTALRAVKNTFTELWDTIFGADWDKTVTPVLGDDSWEISMDERKDSTPWGKYSHQFIPPLKFLESIMGSLGVTDRKDTVYDYLVDNKEMIYKY